MIASTAEPVADGALVVALSIAVVAGLVTFLSPCGRPLVPGHVAFATGLSRADLAAAGAAGRPSGRRMTVGMVGFIAGFSAVFVSFGAIFGGVGALVREHADSLTRIVGVLTTGLGLFFMGAIGRGSLLERHARIRAAPHAGVLAAPLLGAAFAFGWTPCIGPTLAAVLNLAASDASARATRGALLSLAYRVGLGLPFLVFGLSPERSTPGADLQGKALQIPDAPGMTRTCDTRFRKALSFPVVVRGRGRHGNVRRNVVEASMKASSRFAASLRLVGKSLP